MKKYHYNELFQRNIGAFTSGEQKRIKKLKVAIAGAGGLGGPAAYNLARLGVKEIRLADPEKFEPSNINRQFGAYIDTIGKYKTEAIKNELLRINPYLKVKAWNTKINKDNVSDFLDGVDAVIDGIDFFELESAALLYKEAREKKLWVFTGQSAIYITTYTSFKPEGITFEGMVSENGKINVKKAIFSMFPILPKEATPEIIEEISQKGEKGPYSIPSYAVLPPIGGAIVTEELIRVTIKNFPPIAEVPNFLIFDINEMKTYLFKNGKLQRN